MLTMVFAMTLIDLTSLCASFFAGPQRPLPAAGRRSFLEVLSLAHPVWVLVLVASCFLHCAMLFSCFRIYRELRAAGLYPPYSKDPTGGDDVSPFEVVCEPHDVAVSKQCASSRQNELAVCCQCRSASEDKRDSPNNASAEQDDQETLMIDLLMIDRAWSGLVDPLED
jgi:hypothetical protein